MSELFKNNEDDSALVSIIVPIYGVEEYLEKCVNSILAQTYKNIEVILVDDGSPDNCGRICDEYAEKDERIKTVHRENGGLSVARNTGLDMATGDILFFVDSDDSVDVDFVSSAMDVMKRRHADLVCFGYRRITGGGRVTGIFRYKYEQEISAENAIKMILAGKMSIDVWNKAVKRELFHNISFPEGYESECAVVMPKLIDASHHMALCAAVTYNYLSPRKGSICTEGTEKYRNDAITLKEEKYKYIVQSHPELKASVDERRFADCLFISTQDFSKDCRNRRLRRKELSGIISGNRIRILKSRYIGIKHKLWVLLFSVSPKIAAKVYNLYHNHRLKALEEGSKL